MMKLIGVNHFETAAIIIFGIGFMNMLLQDNLIKKFIGLNIIPSGLVLTGIVVSVSVTAFSLALVQRLYKKYGTLSFDEVLKRLRKGSDGWE